MIFYILADLLSDELSKSVAHYNSARGNNKNYLLSQRESLNPTSCFYNLIPGSCLLTSSVLFLDLTEFDG